MTAAGPEIPSPVTAGVLGTVVSIDVAVGDEVSAGQTLAVVESMKMEFPVEAPGPGTVTAVEGEVGGAVAADDTLIHLALAGGTAASSGPEAPVDLDLIRDDLAEVLNRHVRTTDAARPEAVARRHDAGRRTARENVADLVDDGTFVEYAPLVVAAQQQRRELEELIDRTPADGLVGGVGRVNGELFDDDRAETVVMSYDYTVLAGTQGLFGHLKKDRLIEFATEARRPVVVFTEGGGGRPGDTDGISPNFLECLTFTLFARMSGKVPLVGINSGYCFAGNAGLLGCCDVVIATEDSNIGMGGPAMIEGGGLGVHHPTEIGPIEVQAANGVVDVVVADEAEAVAVAKRYLSYFQGEVSGGDCADQRLLRHLVPENRLRSYDVRRVIETMADMDSVLELRSGFGAGMVTALARFDGRPVGIVANNPNHLAGAIDSDAADKAARFMQLCDAHGLPLLFLCDTPGIMVGPEAETTATVRHASRMFLTGATLSVPFFTMVLRKGYGLGAAAMAGGSFKTPWWCVAWPTGEFGGMGLEGAVRLGFRDELAAIEDPAERKARYDELVALAYDRGKALSSAVAFEIDDVIDPADSRLWIERGLRATASVPRTGRTFVDSW